ncbi:MAG: PAS domain-containing protein [Syntrophobacteraceae bacterium]
MMPENKHAESHEYYRTVLDAIPSPVFVVGEDVRIVDMNAAASRMLGSELKVALGRRAGEAIRCFHSTEAEEGCGRGPHCRECVVRNSANRSFDGEKVAREKVRMQLVTEDGIRPVHLLVTTAPFRYDDQSLVLVILEDISELTEMRELIPVCSWCGKIRDDESYWKTIEAYLEKQLDARITHGICPECAEELRQGSTRTPVIVGD